MIGIKFKKSRSNSIGKNGNIITTGIEIYESGNEIFVSPITSRGNSGNSQIGLPMEDVPELIKALKQVYENRK